MFRVWMGKEIIRVPFGVDTSASTFYAVGTHRTARNNKERGGKICKGTSPHRLYTCAILLQTIQKKHRAVMYHLWVDAMTKQQERLDVATFDGKSAIIIKTDFAATAKLQVRLKIFCNRI